MTASEIERRLTDAFRQTAPLEPSPDLWTRVVHSIEEDRLHRRRVRATVAVITATVAVLTGVCALALEDGYFGWYVHRPTFEIVTTAALAVVAMTLGPAIRRFGRGFVADLWPGRQQGTARDLLRVLDLAYAMVLCGYVLLAIDVDPPTLGRASVLAAQLRGFAVELGGALLLIGVLHAITLVALPAVAWMAQAGRPRPPRRAAEQRPSRR